MEIKLLIAAIVIPFVGAFVCLALRWNFARRGAVILTSICMAAIALFFASRMLGGVELIQFRLVEGSILPILLKFADLAMLVFVVWLGFKIKSKWIIGLSIFQLLVSIYLELFSGIKDTVGEVIFRVDYLSLIMLLVVSVIGPLVAIFALGYMKEHEESLGLEKSRQHKFFFVLLLFLAAMNALVLSNNLSWLFFFWEITTLCSFFLIAHDKDDLSIKNATKALWINLLGSLGFTFGILITGKVLGTLSIDVVIEKVKIINQLLASGSEAISATLFADLFGPNTQLVYSPEVLAYGGGLMLLAIAFFCFAGFTKSAMFPFQSWLLGAMVAPTPVSALLHSSTMVKSGVFLIVRFAPIMSGTILGDLVAIIGGFTFVAGAAIAISQTDAKKVLAYSTVSNLGLVVCCAGLGNWLSTIAAVLLIVFHSVSKGLLFLCVGTIEMGIGSRAIEDMQGLFKRMPFTTTVSVVGMVSMLLPPFGVLLTKWMAMESAANEPLILLMVSLGSAFTVAFWAKWVGIILTMSYKKQYKTEKLLPSVLFSLTTLLICVVMLAFFIVPLFDNLVKPYLASVGIKIGIPVSQTLLITLFVVILILIYFTIHFTRKFNEAKIRLPYLCGENTDDIRGIEFIGPGDAKDEVVVHNYYLEGMFGEEKLTKWTNALAGSTILIMFGVIIQRWLIL